MGKINVKLSNNYTVDLNDAAAKYRALNYTTELVIPDVVPGSWQMTSKNSMQDSFGAIAKLANPNGPLQYCLFYVCFLKNQQIGVNSIYEKVLDIQRDNGEITNELRELLEGGTITSYEDYQSAPPQIKPLLKERSLYLRPALLAVEDLNELSEADSYDYDFAYGSSMWTDQANFFVDPFSFSKPTTYRSSKRTKDDYPGSTIIQPGAYGDNPWPKDGMTSFFSANIEFSESISALNEDFNAISEECKAEQESQWVQQWDEINSGPGPAEE